MHIVFGFPLGMTSQMHEPLERNAGLVPESVFYAVVPPTAPRRLVPGLTPQPSIDVVWPPRCGLRTRSGLPAGVLIVVENLADPFLAIV